jgi:hypothetical protein
MESSMHALTLRPQWEKLFPHTTGVGGTLNYGTRERHRWRTSWAIASQL